MANTATHPTMISEATAPAVSLSFSFVVWPRIQRLSGRQFARELDVPVQTGENLTGPGDAGRGHRGGAGYGVGRFVHLPPYVGFVAVSRQRFECRTYW